MEYRLDLTGFYCPLPLLMAKKALETLPASTNLTLLINRFSTIGEFTLLCEQQNYRLLSVERMQTYNKLVIAV